MAKFLNYTPDVVEKIIASFADTLRKKTKFDNIPDKVEMPKVDQKANLLFTATAYVKMKQLVKTYATEVQWEGIVYRLGQNKFVVKDILVAPHEVTGATVTSDPVEFSKWLDTLTDEEFNNKKFHGHSHVNMGVTPSGVDMDFRHDRVNAMPHTDDQFMIFMIMNKKSEYECQIYDIGNNILYNKSDIDIDICMDNDYEKLISDFLADAKTKVTEHKYTAPAPAAQYDSTFQPKMQVYNYKGELVESDQPQQGKKEYVYKYNNYSYYDDDYNYNYSAWYDKK